MESRLLLTGNELTGGDIDSAIFNLDGIRDSYVVISQDSAPSAPSTANVNATPRFNDFLIDIDVDYFQYAITPALDFPLALNDDTTGVIATNIVHSVATITLDLRPADSFDTTGLDHFRNLLDPGAFFADRPLNGNHARYGGSLEFDSQSLLSLNLGTSIAHAVGSGGSVTLVGSPLAESPAIVPVVKLIVVQPADSTNIGNGVTVEFVSTVPATDLPVQNANVAASKVKPPPDSSVGNMVDVVATVREVASILPARQPTKDEQLADAIDELLSDDSIFGSPSGQSGSEFVVDGTPHDASSDLAANGQPASGAALGEAFDQQIADGGMISLDVIVAVTAESSTTIAAPETHLALDESSDVVGELSRVAVMELIEGEAEPGTLQAADRVAVRAKDDASDSLEAVQTMTRRAGVAIAMAAPASPAYLAKIAGVAVDAAGRAMATLVGSNWGAEATANVAPADVAPADDARSEAFSQLGADYDDELAAADAGSMHWNNWLAAAPLIVALACERAIASRKNRQQRDSLRRPLTAK